MDFIKMIMELPGEKRSQDVVDSVEWNNLWRQIVMQGNHSENYLQELYDYLFNQEEGWVHKVQAELDGVQPYLEGIMTQPVGKAPDGSLWTYPSTESGTVPWGNVMGDITRQQDLMQELDDKADVEHEHDISTLTFNEGDIDSSWIHYNSQDIPTNALKDLSVTSEKLSNGAVTSAKIASGAVINNSIANYSVSGVKIADGTITGEKLGNGAVTAEKIPYGAVSGSYTATVSAADWTGESAPYTNSVSVPGLLAADRPIIDLVPSETYATAEAEDEAWGYVYRAVAAANTLSLYAKEKPETDLNIQMVVIRK